MVALLNDLDADGRDVSWIWDADFDALADLDVPVVAAGRRSEDLAVRLKYAGVPVEAVCREPAEAIRLAAARTREDRLVVVVATYTAMLDARQAILGRVARVRDSAA